MEKKPDTTQKPKDHERKLESGLGSHWRSVSALIANNMVDMAMNAAEKKTNALKISHLRGVN